MTVNGDTYTRLGAGFAIGTTTAWRYVRERYVRETIDLLAALADDLHTAAARAAKTSHYRRRGQPIDS